MAIKKTNEKIIDMKNTQAKQLNLLIKNSR